MVFRCIAGASVFRAEVRRVWKLMGYVGLGGRSGEEVWPVTHGMGKRD